MLTNVTKKELCKELISLCQKCECMINSMRTKDDYPKRCPWRSISGDYCDFINSKYKEIEESYNEN